MKIRVQQILMIVVEIVFITACKEKIQSPKNLVFNGSAELPKFDSVPKGWIKIQGNWSTFEGDSVHHDYGFAQDGKHYFFAGQDSLGILQQDVNVSDFAARIDGHKQQFVLKGFEHTLNQGPISDQGMITLKALDCSKSKTLYRFSSDKLMSKNKWLIAKDSFLAPPYTRFIRINLIAIRHVGGDNDGYLDNISLIPLPVEKGYLKYIIFVAIICLLVICFILISKRKKQQT